MTNSDITILSAPWLIPVEPSNVVLENYAVVFDNDKILDLMPIQSALEKFPEATHINRPNHALFPGLINSHTHAAMNLFKGLADDRLLMDWLENHIWPAEAKWVDAAFMRDGVELAIAEMLLSGTTCFNDMYFYPDIVAKTAQKTGIRAHVSLIVLDFPSVWANSSDEYFEKGLRVHDETRSLSLVQTTLAPHAPYTVSDEPLKKVRTFADELQVPIHMHIHETAQEVADSKQQYKCSPLQRLNSLGLLNPRMIAVHMTQLNNEEIALCAEQGIHVVHCPESNQKLASGYCRANDLMSAGVNVCLGTDSSASNNDLDMLGEMRSAALMAKNLSASAEALPAWQALEMATINGAKALNIDDQTGSLKKGKVADIVAIDLNHVSTQPVYDPISQIVYCASRDQISDVWIQGRQVVKNKTITTIDIEKVIANARNWRDKIQQSNLSNES
ncbi:MAG: TRZ/ATZ family hydrolase [Acidiferrobacterales bacterium]|nr:TRZ/ATZ family hydrolase [Acidiferrobacterales bacterium]